MRPEDLYALTWAADPRLSPDGQTAAVVVMRIDREQNDYAGAIWLVPVDGGEPRRFTAGAKQDLSPRWSPDGTRIAFVSNRAGEKKQLYVIPVEGGEAVQLTALPEDVTEPVWSPDSTRIAFSSRVPDPAYEEEDERRRAPRRFTRLAFKHDEYGWTGDRRRHIFAVAADGSSEPRQLTHGDFESMSPAWSPDSQTIVFVSDRHEDWDLDPLVHDLYLVDADGSGEPRRLTERESNYEAPAFSPDGRLIACRWCPGGLDWPRHLRIALVDAQTGERRVLTEQLDRNCGPHPPVREPVWDRDSILFPVEDRGNTHVYRVAADGSRPPEAVVGGELWVHGFDAAAGVVVHAASTPTRPAELFAGERRLTRVTDPFTASVALVEPERFVAPSSEGAEVEAWIVRPAGFEPGRKYPTLLNIHGGPFTQYGNKFFDEFQVYAGAGYAVLYSNPRGSSGYSEQWGRAIRGPGAGGPGWGTRDYDDVIAVVDEALRRFDFCDADRLGVIGGSYGGFMTSWIVGHTDRFRAACSERAVNNLLSMFGSSDIPWFERAYMDVWPWDDVQAYLEKSPTTYAQKITTPLLILHAERDLRCNIEQAEHLFTLLRLLRREVELVRFTAEGHELTRSGSPLHRVMRFELLLEWFASHLHPERVVEREQVRAPA